MLLALIIHDHGLLGSENKGIENQPGENFFYSEFHFELQHLFPSSTYTVKF